MTEERKPKLGQTTNDLFAAARGGYVTEVDLLPGEVPLKAWEVGYRKGLAGAWGILYLTTHRFVWIRSTMNVRWVSKRVAETLEIPLDAVTGVVVGRKWQLWLIPYGRGSLLVRKRVGEPWEFWPARTSPSPKEIAQEITSILRERGLLRD